MSGQNFRSWMISALFGSVLTAHSAHAAEVAISAIQGADHKTTLPTNQEVEVVGVVTAHFGKGFFMQSVTPDSDLATSEGIFVFLGNSPTFALPDRGATVHVTGKPMEFQPLLELPLQPNRKVAVCGTTQIDTIQSEDRKRFLPVTQIGAVTALTVEGTANMPAAIEFIPPGANSDIAFADRPNTPFNPVDHPRDYFESLEGMRVVVRDAVVVSRKEKPWDQFWVASASSLDASELSAYGLPFGKPGHVFPEVVAVHKAKNQPGFAAPVGTHLGDLEGVMTYENGNYMIVLDKIIDAATLPVPSLPSVPEPDIGTGLRVATYNAENMSIASPGASTKIKNVAEQIVAELKSPALIGLQEVQDDDGEGATDLVTAQQTLAALVTAIIDAGGPAYQVVAIDPILPNTDGGAPGGNIRTVFLVRSDSGITVKHAERLFDTDDRCDRDANPFSSARKPLLLEAEIAGEPYVFVNLHLSSKLGDEGLYSNSEDPQPGSTANRKRQVERLVTELEQRYASNPPTIILMGDYNDHIDSPALAPFHASSLGFKFPRDHRGESFTISYAFSGLREAIDQFLIGGRQRDVLVTYMNLNVDAQIQVSDHNPVILELR
jgi:predicted extracellular nuclease